MAPPRKKTSSIVTRLSSAAAATPPVIEEAMDIEPPIPAVPLPKDKDNGAATESSTPPRPPPATSPTKCAICLGELVNRCYTNSCIHQFCFACLLQWSKVKPECPLCKSLFQSIYHNIRTNEDYDEYNVPSPEDVMPTLSIHFGPHDPFTTGPYRSTATFRRLAHQHHPFVPQSFREQYHDHGYSFHRFMTETERAVADRMRDPSYIRILEMGPLSEPRAFDLMHMNTGVGSRLPLDNPFYSDEPEYFGSFTNGPPPGSRPSATQGYTRRRRVYDRGQYVQSFSSGSAIPPGTVFFPSVDYFRTHPSSYSRVSEWLHRELSVLLGLNYSRTEMGSFYDTILSILLRHDIRSSEFRNTVRDFLNDRSRHFQHEFYNFVLSGMRVEEYDRCAVYSSPSRSGPSAAGTSSTEGVPHSGEPPVVTISDDDESDVSEIAQPEPVNDPRRGPRGTVIQNPEAIDLSDDAAQDPIAPITSSAQRPTTSIDFLTAYHTAMGRSGIAPRMTNEQDWINYRPVPDVDFSGLHSARSRRPRISTYADDRAQRLEDVRARLQVHREFQREAATAHASPPPAHSSSSVFSSIDFLRPSRLTVPPSSSTIGWHDHPLIVSPGSRSGGSQRQRSSATDGDSDGIPYRKPYGRRHDSPNTSSSSVEQSQDLSRHGGLSCVPLPVGVGVRISQASRPPRNASISSERRMLSPLPNTLLVISSEGEESRPAANNVAPEDPDEIELLGVHPIVKPPPLAVITLSSDEEETAEEAQARRLKTENQAAKDRPQAQAHSSPDLVIDDEFLNWTMEPPSRGLNVFPLSDNDEVQPIMDFRPDPPTSTIFFNSGLSVAGTSSGGSFNPLRPTISNPTQTSPPRARYGRHCKTVLTSPPESKSKIRSTEKRKSGSCPLRLSDTDEDEESDHVEVGPDSTTDPHHKRTKKISEHKKELKAERKAHKRTACPNKLTTRSRHTHSWKETVKRKQDSKSKKESKSRKRKRTALSSAYVSTSESDWDTEPPAGPLTPLPRSSFFSPPPEPSTSTGSPQVPSTSRQGLLDLRTAVKRQNKLSKRERRWESDDGESNDSDVPTMGLILAPTQNSDSSLSPTGSSFSRPSRLPLDEGDSSSSEAVFASGTDTSSITEQLFGPEDFPPFRSRHDDHSLSFCPPSPPAAESFRGGSGTQHRAPVGHGRPRLGSERLFQPFYVPTSSEDESCLLDLSVASGPLPDDPRVSNLSPTPRSGWYSPTNNWYNI